MAQAKVKKSPIARPAGWQSVVIPPLLEEQKRDAAILHRQKRAGDFSEPGAGKTLTALAAADLALREPVGPGRPRAIVIIAPPIAQRMWAKTAAKFFDTDDVAILTTATGVTNETFLGLRAIVLTYALACSHAVRSALNFVNIHVLILDEADALKTMNSTRTQAIYGRNCNMKNCIGADAPYVFALTGTPIMRYHDDVYPHFKALRPDILKDPRLNANSFEAFCKTFCYGSYKSFHPRQPKKFVVEGDTNHALLNNIMYANGGLAVRRFVKDLVDMPQLVEADVPCNYLRSPDLAAATALFELSAESEYSEGMSTMRRLLGVAKAPFAADYVTALHQRVQQPVLVFFWHKEAGDALEGAISTYHAGARVGRIDGATSSKKKAELEDAFNSGELDYLLGQIASMGVSLNLQRGSSRAVFLELDWSAGKEEQAYKRLWRMGQKSVVYVDRLLTDHPGDEMAAHVIEKKKTSAAKKQGYR